MRWILPVRVETEFSLHGALLRNKSQPGLNVWYLELSAALSLQNVRSFYFCQRSRQKDISNSNHELEGPGFGQKGSVSCSKEHNMKILRSSISSLTAGTSGARDLEHTLRPPVTTERSEKLTLDCIPP